MLKKFLQDMVVHFYNPNTSEVEEEDGFKGQPGLYSETLSQKNPKEILRKLFCFSPLTLIS
jgi:hypothetical protein